MHQTVFVMFNLTQILCLQIVASIKVFTDIRNSESNKTYCHVFYLHVATINVDSSDLTRKFIWNNC
jgi:hypothetical protein